MMSFEARLTDNEEVMEYRNLILEKNQEID